ncbi:MAG: hypothetical protein VZQ97_02830 [Candidatus Onthomonas sp.]|nr:hypothetical protein [Candidatus Onthomonas sp.]
MNSRKSAQTVYRQLKPDGAFRFIVLWLCYTVSNTDCPGFY